MEEETWSVKINRWFIGAGNLLPLVRLLVYYLRLSLGESGFEDAKHVWIMFMKSGRSSSFQLGTGLQN